MQCRPCYGLALRAWGVMAAVAGVAQRKSWPASRNQLLRGVFALGRQLYGSEILWKDVSSGSIAAGILADSEHQHSA